jgi:uncharacterized protein (TIGR03083 family)
MHPERYLELIDEDGRRLAEAARQADPAAAIPTCPGWTVQDCVVHTGEVYQHKIACMRLGRLPGDDYPQAPPPGVDPVDWYESCLATLLTELRDRDPAAPTFTWWPTDRTVGFWYRRMAQETAVHRLDVEDGLGDPTPVDPELAVDGIDEVLDAFLATFGGTVDHAAPPPTVAVRSAGRTWRVTLGPDAVALARDDGEAEATVAGDPEPVLLWLWGRRPDATVALEGDPAALAALRDRLHAATQ